MPRRARELSSSKIYHIVFRGINKQNIFYDDADYEKMLKKLEKLKKEMKFEIYAYCLMSNHVHLLIKEQNSGDISTIMKRLLISYVQFFNKRYERIGKLINDRYLSKPVINDTYLLALVKYIHQNPLKIGISINYKWSSYGKYFVKDILVDKELILNMIGKDNFVEYNNVIEIRNLDPDNKLRLSNNEIIEQIKTKYDFNPKEVIFMDKTERNNILAMLRENYSARQISSITGISYGVVAKQKNEKQKRPGN